MAGGIPHFSSSHYVGNTERLDSGIFNGDLCDTAPRLPVELWNEVFKLLLKNDARQLAMTCHALAVIARPHLFCELKLMPPYQTSSIKRLKERLTFYAHPTIAAHVRHFTVFISPRCHNAVFTLLPKLVRLTTLSLRDVSLDLSHLRVLARLPSLQSLKLIDCTIVLNDTPVDIGSLIPQIPVKAMFVNGSSKMSLWPLLLHPDHLEELGGLDCRFSFEPHVIFPHVRRLSCIMRVKGCLSLLENFPALEELYLSDPNHVDPSTWKPSAKYAPHLPKLKSFKGSLYSVHRFVRNGSLLHAQLWSSMDGADSSALCFVLSELAKIAPLLQTLHIYIPYFTSEVLSAFCNFRCLETLQVYGKRNDSAQLRRDELISSLCTIEFPSTLRSLLLSAYFDETADDDLSKTRLIEWARAQPSLQAAIFLGWEKNTQQRFKWGFGDWESTRRWKFQR